MANVKISALPAATSVASADVLPIVQSATTKKATIQNVSDALGMTTTVSNVSPGLVYITQATLSNVTNSGTTFDNVFSSNYDNFRIVASNLTGSTTTQTVKFQFRSSGPATLNTNYFLGGFFCTFSGVSGTQSVSGGADWWFNNVNSGARCGGVMDLQFPNSSVSGIKTAQWQIFNNDAWVGYGGAQGTATAATGFILSVGVGTFSGTISVYGYRKA